MQKLRWANEREALMMDEKYTNEDVQESVIDRLE